MLDHILADLVTHARRSLERALLQRQAVEERFQVDVFLGDVSWETSYSLPGEETPPRVRADVSVDWPTWSQSAYRSWSIGEPPEDLPEAVVEVALRVQRLAEVPPTDLLMACLPEESALIGKDALVRAGVVVEQVVAAAAGGGGDGDGDGERPSVAVEATYQGTIGLDESELEDPAALAGPMDDLARWIASVLVRLGDLDLRYVPPDGAGGSGEGEPR